MSQFKKYIKRVDEGLFNNLFGKKTKLQSGEDDFDFPTDDAPAKPVALGFLQVQRRPSKPKNRPLIHHKNTLPGQGRCRTSKYPMIIH